MRLGRVLTSILAALAFVGAGTAPASAEAAGAGFHAGYTCVGAHCFQITLSMQVQPTGLGQHLVEFECTAIAFPDPASTSIDRCSVGDQNALLTPVTFPGAYAKAAGVVFLTPGTAVTVCALGHATFVETILGPQTVSGGGCTYNVIVQVPLTA